MPTITIRLSERERDALADRADRADQTVSDYIRETLELRHQVPDLASTIQTLIERSNHAIVVGTLVDQHETRLNQLERVANLD